MKASLGYITRCVVSTLSFPTNIGAGRSSASSCSRDSKVMWAELMAGWVDRPTMHLALSRHWATNRMSLHWGKESKRVKVMLLR